MSIIEFQKKMFSFLDVGVKINKHSLLLIMILTVIVFIVEALTVFSLYNAAFEQQRAQLIATTQSQAKLIEAVARFDQQYSTTDIEGGAATATLKQIRDTRLNNKGFGKSGEFLFGKIENDKIIFLLPRRFKGVEDKQGQNSFLNVGGSYAEPIQLALEGKSGTIIARDYRGEQVLAAYAPVRVLNFGVVTKIDMKEIREPYIRVGLISVLVAVVLIFIGAFLFLRITEPMVKRIENSAARLNDAQHLAKVGSWDLDLLSSELSWSDEIFNIFEIDKSKFHATYEGFLNAIHPDDLDKVNKAYSDSLIDRKPYEITHRLQMSDGTIKYVHETCESFFKNDKPVRSVGTVQDITQLYKTEQELKSAMRLNELVINASPIGIVIYDERGQCISANESTAAIVGATLEQVLQQNYHKIKSWEKSGLLKAANLAVESGVRQRDEFEVTTTFGKHAIYDCMFMPFTLNDRTHLILMIDDVTERKHAEKELENIFDLSLDMIGAGNLQGYFSKINSSFKRILGYEDEEFMVKPFIEYVYEEDLEETLATLKEAMAGKKDLYTVNRYNCKDGSIKWIEWNVIANAEENTFYATGRDITERKQAEKVLKDSEERLRMAMSAADIGTWKWDIVTNQDTRDANFNRILGLEATESTQLVEDFVERIHPDDRAAVEQELKRSIRDRDIYLDEFRIIHPDGTERWLRDQGLPYYDEQNKISYMTGAVVDITERKQAEDELAKHREHLEERVLERTQELHDAQDELVRKERLATLGQLTATVSHELRNPLGAMRPSLYVIEKKSDKTDERIQSAIERIDRNINRCDHIIDELLDFTRITELELKPTLIDKWLTSVILEQIIPEEILLKKDFGLNNIELAVDTDRLRRAVINAIENSCHSMMDDNQQSIKNNAHIHIKTCVSNNRVEIIIKDTGRGIAKDVIDKVFEPLFSTKSFGVGLGMPAIKQIMQQHGGEVEVESEEGKGTTVTLWLPLNESEQSLNK